jgi:hypothetical protein
VFDKFSDQLREYEKLKRLLQRDIEILENKRELYKADVLDHREKLQLQRIIDDGTTTRQYNEYAIYHKSVDTTDLLLGRQHVVECQFQGFARKAETKSVGVQKKWTVPQKEMATQVDNFLDRAERQSCSSKDSNSPRSARALLIPPRISKLFVPKGSARDLPFQLESQDQEDCMSLQFDLNKIEQRSFLLESSPIESAGLKNHKEFPKGKEKKTVIGSSNDLSQQPKANKNTKLPTTPRGISKNSQASNSTNKLKSDLKSSAKLVIFCQARTTPTSR